MCPICEKEHNSRELCPDWKDRGQDRYMPEPVPSPPADVWERMRFKIGLKRNELSKSI